MKPIQTRPLVLLLALLSGALSPGPVRSQPLTPSAPAEPDVPKCESNPACLSLYDQAIQARSTNLSEALRLYHLAYQVQADPTLLFNIARMHHRLGQADEATKYYQRFIDSPINDPKQKQTARDHIAELKPSSQTPPMPASAPLVVTSPGPPKEERKPVYKKWWFWTILGTVTAAGIAGGVAGGIAASQRIPEPVFRSFETP